MKEKKQGKSPSAFGHLMEYAGRFKSLTYLSLILSALSSMLALLPFVCIWRIIREVLEVQPDFSKATGIVRNGWMAVLFSVLAWLVYVSALVCSHGSAFRTAANMKKTLMRHIVCLPIGFADEMGSGKVRRTVTEVTGSTETLLAHNLPDMAGAITMPVCMMVMLFLYNWRYGVTCLIPVALSFAVMMRMAGPAMQEDMRQYQNALERMSNEAVEYVRGVPVVKTFGQTVFSFHRFKASIDDYCEFCMHYTRMMRSSMVGYTVLINSAFVFILGLTLLLIRGENYQMDILLNFLFYVIFTPAIATAMTKVMFMSENNMKVEDAIARTDPPAVGIQSAAERRCAGIHRDLPRPEKLQCGRRLPDGTGRQNRRRGKESHRRGAGPGGLHCLRPADPENRHRHGGRGRQRAAHAGAAERDGVFLLPAGGFPPV